MWVDERSTMYKYIGTTRALTNVEQLEKREAVKAATRAAEIRPRLLLTLI